MSQFPFKADQMAVLGGRGKPMSDGASIHYAAMVIRKERERLASIFKNAGMEKVAAAITDTSHDLDIFKLR
jgi:CO dehydrogenase/acetyl-CoA synthase delta subunit